jgi:hypothetical protein
VQIFSLLIDKPNYEAAEKLLDTWERFVPGDPMLDAVRPLVKDSTLARLHTRQMLAALRE